MFGENKYGAFVYGCNDGYALYVINSNGDCEYATNYSCLDEILKDVSIFIKKDHWAYFDKPCDKDLKENYNKSRNDYEIPGILVMIIGKEVVVYPNAHPRFDREAWSDFLLRSMSLEIPKINFLE